MMFPAKPFEKGHQLTTRGRRKTMGGKTLLEGVGKKGTKRSIPLNQTGEPQGNKKT